MDPSWSEPLRDPAPLPWPDARMGPAVVRRAISGVDALLSRRGGVASFSEDPACILRYSLTRSPGRYRLSDGVEISPATSWSTCIAGTSAFRAMPKGGADLRWAHQASGRLRASLRLLAAACVTQPSLRPVRACRARVNFVGQGSSNASVSRIIDRLGFEDVDEGAGSIPARIHDALENVLIGALVWTHNPEALRRDKMIRERRPVWSSREKLLRLHGTPGAAEAVPSSGTDRG